MIGRIFTVGGLTLLSRLTGLARDILLAAVLGAGPAADAFFVAWRLPNHFRAIFAEGAFNAAFVPAYARIRTTGGIEPAKLFADRVFTLLFTCQIVLLAIALLFTPAVIAVLAPGLSNDPGRFTLAVELTRITFPYLLLVTLVTLYGGILNALQRFAAAAAAPILLNLSMMATLAVATRFSSPAHAAAWGVLAAGLLEVILVGGDALHQRVMTVFRAFRWDEDIKRFFTALGPAVVGSAGLQIALFADTVIATFLSAGALSALYYADRLNQLPIGVIGIAAGTVVLPEMASRIAAGDEAGAARAQNRAIELTLLLSIPCIAAFLLVPDLIMRVLFMRGAFTAADAAAAGQTLAAYALGLLPFVLIRSVVASFLARGDTATPVRAALVGAAVNIGFKIFFFYATSLAQIGLAFATTIGAWLNFGLALWFASRRGHIQLDAGLAHQVGRLAAAGVGLAVALLLARWPIAALLSAWNGPRDMAELAALAAIGAVVYGGLVLALFGPQWRKR
jgi:putative peptidoglycan lipid II flippase